MDPNATLKRVLESANAIVDGTSLCAEDDGFALAELVLSLDSWIKKGGALPSEWARAIAATRPL